MNIFIFYRQLHLRLICKSIWLAVLFLLSISVSYIKAETLEHIVFEWPNPYNMLHPNRIELLRPEGYAHQHGLKKSTYYRVTRSKNMAFPERVKLITIDKYKTVNNRNKNQYAMVTGTFIHQSETVKVWRFIDEHRHITVLNATDNHPFYVKNLHAFLPIKDITSKMSLDAGAHTLHLLCRNRLNCGQPFHSDKPVYVYNIEVKKRHVYRVGEENILVHNCSELTTDNNSGPTTEERGSISSPNMAAMANDKPADEIIFKEASGAVNFNREEYMPEPRQFEIITGEENGNYYGLYKIPHYNDRQQVFTIKITDGQWVISNIPPDMGSGNDYYLEFINKKLSLHYYLSRIDYAPGKVEVNVGAALSPQLEENFITSEMGILLHQAISEAHRSKGAITANIGNVKVNGSRITFDVRGISPDSVIDTLL